MNGSAFRFCDDLGPKTILHVYQPTVGLKAIVVVDNVAAGPAILKPSLSAMPET